MTANEDVQLAVTHLAGKKLDFKTLQMYLLFLRKSY